MRKFLDEFKEFVNRGNIIDLAVAVVLGTAFAAVVAVFVDGVLMRMVAAMIGEPSFDNWTIDVGDARILIGSFVTEVVNFVLVAFAVFMVVKAMVAARRPSGEEADEAAPSEAELLAEIRDLLKQRT